MPCRDYYDDHPDQYFKDVTEPALKKQVSFAESALCQTLAAFSVALLDMQLHVGQSVNPLDHIDYAEAGIKREDLEAWWKNHKMLDEKHREEERLKKVKKAALAKLTTEERKVLGIR
jgi:hypothetical protein